MRGQIIDLLSLSAVKSKLIRCLTQHRLHSCYFMQTSVSCTFWVVCSTQDTFNVTLHEVEVLALDKVCMCPQANWRQRVKMSARVFMNSSV